MALKIACFLVFAGGVILASGHAQAQFLEDFESLTTSWKRSETDCVIRSHHWKQARVNELRRQNRFERIEFQNGPGRFVFIAHDVPPSLVIPELKPSIRLRCAKAGAQLYVRVVLPNTPAPNGKGPMKALLRGPVYRNADRWETLSFDQMEQDLSEILKQEIWVLRNKHGQRVTGEGAYIDKVAINAYSGEGQTQLDIDDLKIDGRVSATRLADGEIIRRDDAVSPVSLQQETQDEKVQSLVKRDGTVLLVNKQPFFPRIIQHNGEPFEYLKTLGFNVIELRRVATEQQLRTAGKLDIWLICPPPSTVGLKPIEFRFDRVLAWSVGQDLEGRDLPVVEQRVREIRESDLRFGRPVIGHARSEWSRLGKLTDVVNAGIEPLGTSFIASQYSDWLMNRREAIGTDKPLWADIQTELSQSLIAQIKSLTPQLPPVPVEPQQIKYLAYEAIAAGCRGLRFRSENRLDDIGPVSRLRALTLEWINRELDQLEPWIVGGALLGTLDLGAADNSLSVTAINTNRSRLLLVQRSTHHEQYLAGDLPPTRIAFRDADSPYTNHAYLLSQWGLTSLANVRGVSGTEIQIDDCPYATAVVLTQDPLVVNRLDASYQEVGRQTILSLHAELTRQWLAIEQLIDAQITNMGRRSESVSGLLGEAAIAFQNAQEMMQQGNDQVAEQYLHAADARLATARRELIIEPLGKFQSKTSAPLTSHASLIPLHWELASRLAEGKWSPNGLAGGDFENLQHMLSHGWQNRSLNGRQVVTNVDLAHVAAVDGNRGLKLSVEAVPDVRPLLETPPLQIETPAVPVRAGQLVRIHGWVQVPRVINGSMDGLRVTDSLGGPSMSERILLTNGWQEFTLYRGVANDGEISVRFELTGLGTVYLDEVTIRTIDLPVVRQAKRTE